MKNTNLMDRFTRSIHKTGLKLKKHSPEILIVAGVIGTVGAAVMACKATLKVNEVLDTTKDELDIIKADAEEGIITQEEAKQEKAKTYLATGLDLAKLYGPAVAVELVSVAAILKGNNILRKRNIALAAAYTAVHNDFKQYRGRVVERFGEALDRELRYNLKEKEIEETVTNEDGSESVVTKTITVSELDDYSPFARFFDDGCRGWTKDPSYNLLFLKQQQNEANKRLKREGFLFLNDIFDMLGIPRCRLGQEVGWIYDEAIPNGDNFIDFGIFDTTRAKNMDFVNGYERTIILDFNVDGYILDKIWSTGLDNSFSGNPARDMYDRPRRRIIKR